MLRDSFSWALRIGLETRISERAKDHFCKVSVFEVQEEGAGGSQHPEYM